MFCNQCGSAMPDDAAFCPICGSKAIPDSPQSADPEHLPNPVYNSHSEHQKDPTPYSYSASQYNQNDNQANQQYPPQQYHQPGNQMPYAPTPPKDNRKLIIILICIVAVLLLAAVFFLVRALLNNDSDKDAKTKRDKTTITETRKRDRDDDSKTEKTTSKQETEPTEIEKTKETTEETTREPTTTQTAETTEADSQALIDYLQGDWISQQWPDGTHSVIQIYSGYEAVWLLTYPGAEPNPDSYYEGFINGSWYVEVLSYGYMDLDYESITFYWDDFEDFTIYYEAEIIDENTMILTEYYEGESYTERYERVIY